jgi:hypothetical protein
VTTTSHPETLSIKHSLTVLVAPESPGLGILSVLRDWNALGLLTDFLWLPAHHVQPDQRRFQALEISGGVSRQVDLQEALAHRPETTNVRICVLDPFDGQNYTDKGDQVGRVLEASSPTIDRVLIHALISVLDEAHIHRPTISQGWVGFMVAPEQSASPAAPRIQMRAADSEHDLAMHYSVGLASALGMWIDIDQSPLDEAKPHAENQFRLLQSFLEVRDAREVMSQLRGSLTQMDPKFPRPLSDGKRLPAVDDEEGAAITAAKEFVKSHESLMRGKREKLPASTKKGVGILEAIRMFLSFFGAALRRAPGEWMRRIVDGSRNRAANRTQDAIFGSNSEFEVVARGVKQDGRLATPEEIRAAAAQLIAKLGGSATHSERPIIHRDLWARLSDTAMDLADGGNRARIHPTVGGKQAVLETTSAIATPPTENFTDLPPSVVNRLGVSEISTCDPLTAQDVIQRLQAIEMEEGLNAESGKAKSDVESWFARSRKSFLSIVGVGIASLVGAIRKEIHEITDQIRRIQEALKANEELEEIQRKLARWMRIIFWISVVAIIGLLGAAQFEWVLWDTALKWIAGVFVAMLLTEFILFFKEQQALFKWIHRNRDLSEQLEVLQRNLQAALIDLQRLEEIYRQFVPAAEVLASFLNQPLGPPREASRGIVLPSGDLPLNVAVGRVELTDEEQREILERLNDSLFDVGWMTEPFQRMSAGAAAQVGRGNEDVFKDPTILHNPSGGQGSGMHRWAAALSEVGVPEDLGDATWARAVSLLEDPEYLANTRSAQQVQWAGERKTTESLTADSLDPSHVDMHFDTEILRSESRSANARQSDQKFAETRNQGLGRESLLVVCSPTLGITDLSFQAVDAGTSIPVPTEQSDPPPPSINL